MRQAMPIAAMLLLLMCGCTEKAPDTTALVHYPLDSIDEIGAVENVSFDSVVSYDGQGSIKITATDSTVVNLFNISDPDIENTRLLYRARIKSENVIGQAYLEMWCAFPGKGEYFTRDLLTPITGSRDWMEEEVAFVLEKGQKPSSIRLNVVFEGSGIVWIDDIRLLTSALK